MVSKKMALKIAENGILTYLVEENGIVRVSHILEEVPEPDRKWFVSELTRMRILSKTSTVEGVKADRVIGTVW